MSAPKGQAKSGTSFTRGGNSSKSSGGSVPKGQARTGTTFVSGGSRTTAGSTGGPLEGQHLRGYVHDAARNGLPAPQDVTVAPDGTRRVRGDKRA